MSRWQSIIAIILAIATALSINGSAMARGLLGGDDSLLGGLTGTVTESVNEVTETVNTVTETEALAPPPESTDTTER